MDKSLNMVADKKAVFSKRTLKAPSFLIEYAYYALLFYGMLGGALGVTVPLVGAGALAGLAILSLMHFGQGSMVAFKPIMLAFGCGISALIIQLVIHQESFQGNAMRSLVTWIFSLIVIQTISFRKGFLHRFALVAFLIGCGTLPFLKTYVSTDEMIRMGVSHDVGLANPNAFGMWFGFCCVYFLVVGLETRNYLVRMAAWSAVLLCIYLVGITVSRGPLLGIFLAAAFAFKKVLNRSFVPIVVLLWFGWIIYMSGLFDELIGYYLMRGSEESGRSYLWAGALDSFLGAWLTGVGLSNAKIPHPFLEGLAGNPHNSLLYIAMASGVIPLALFIGHILRSARDAFWARQETTPYSPFKLPLFIFAFLEMMIIGQAFMSPWIMIVFSMIMTPGKTRQIHGMKLGENVSHSRAHGMGW